MKKSPQKTISPQQKLKKQIYQRDQLQKIVAHYEAAGKLETQAAKKVISHLRSLNRIINNKHKFNHKVVEVKREATYKPTIHTEKDNLIKMLQNELACTILALSSYDPYDENESREARLEYKSYLNIRMVLGELTSEIRTWDTQYYGNAKRYSCDYISEAFKILKTSKRRVLNVLGDTCGKCGASGKVEIHHIVPISKDGSAEIENLMVLCHGCHKEAHKYDVHSNTTPTKKFSASFTIGNFVRVEQEA